MKSMRMWSLVVVCLMVCMFAGTAAYAADGDKKVEQGKASDVGVLGDLSAFRKIAEDTLDLVNKNQLADAKARIKDLETAWDVAEEKMKPMNSGKWNSVDKSIDRVLALLRSSNPVQADCAAALKTLIAKFNALSPKADAPKADAPKSDAPKADAKAK